MKTTYMALRREYSSGEINEIEKSIDDLKLYEFNVFSEESLPFYQGRRLHIQKISSKRFHITETSIKRIN
jgi:hypothetical protein